MAGEAMWVGDQSLPDDERGQSWIVPKGQEALLQRMKHRADIDHHRLHLHQDPWPIHQVQRAARGSALPQAGGVTQAMPLDAVSRYCEQLLAGAVITIELAGLGLLPGAHAGHRARAVAPAAQPRRHSGWARLRVDLHGRAVGAGHVPVLLRRGAMVDALAGLFGAGRGQRRRHGRSRPGSPRLTIVQGAYAAEVISGAIRNVRAASSRPPRPWRSGRTAPGGTSSCRKSCAWRCRA